MSKFVLYGMPASLYTGKVRAYMLRQRIDFEERGPGDPRFISEIVPAVGRWIIPVLQYPDGRLVQDGNEILEPLEREGFGREPLFPENPLLRVIARLFEWFGSEGLLRPSMHYRWNFDADNRAFLREDFGVALAAPNAPREDRDSAFEQLASRMQRATSRFGVTAASSAAIEKSYLEFLALLDDHLSHHAYLLGQRPSLGDYGLYAALHAHLGRDPHPARLMQQRAVRVWLWRERMSQSSSGAELLSARPVPTDSKSLPDSLKALMRFIAEDYLPECEAYVNFTNNWLAARPELEAGTNGLPSPGDRVIGMTEFEWRGHRLTVSVMPYRILLLQKIQDEIASLPSQFCAPWDELMKETGLSALGRMKVSRRVERRNNLEVWGASTGR
jgi:glutathione S-transferase